MKKGIFLLLLCLIVSLSNAFAGGKKDKKEKSAAQDTAWYALVYKTWKIAKVDVPAIQQRGALPSEFDKITVKLSPGHRFYISAPDFLYTGSFFTIERQYRKYIITDFLAFEITSIGSSTLEILLKTPIPDADKIKLSFYTSTTTDFDVPLNKICQQWSLESKHYPRQNYNKVDKIFMFDLDKDGHYKMLNDTVLSEGSWTIDKTNLTLKLLGKGKLLVYYIKMCIDGNLSLSPLDYPDSIIGMRKSYTSLNNIDRVKGNYNDEDEQNYDAPLSVTDTVKMVAPADTTPPPVMMELPQQTHLSTEKLVYDYVDEMPQFPGGEAECLKYVSTHIMYPPAAVENNVQGKVILSFVVDTVGSILDVKILRNLPMGCGEEAVRVVKAMPKWKPGKLNGNPVYTRYTLPINFMLKK